jgi:hypothetical protein
MKKILLIFCSLFVALSAYTQIDYLSELEKVVYQQHKEEIDSRFEIAKQDKYLEYATHYTLKKVYVDELKILIGAQEIRKLVYDYIYPDDHVKRYSEKTKVEKDYCDAIDRILLLSGNDISSPNFYIVLHYSDGLNLTPEQIEEFTKESLAVKKVLDKSPRRDMWRNELEVLQKLLDEKQLDYFFVLKNGNKMKRETVFTWSLLKDAGLTNDLDSATACQQIYLHKLKIQKATDINAYDDTKKREAWSAIDMSAPVPVKRIYSINRKNLAKKQGYKGSFIW